jgi:DNA-binding CsgD family transcriptional regulator
MMPHVKRAVEMTEEIRGSGSVEAHDRNAFESAIARLPYPVFVVDDNDRLRTMNSHARALVASDRLRETLLDTDPSHPLAQAVARIRTGPPGDDAPVLVFPSGSRFELIHSTPSVKGAKRWLMLMLRPVTTRAVVDLEQIRMLWNLTRREGEIAARCIAGKTTIEICESLYISRETLKTHMSRILRKAGCETRAQLVTHYFMNAPEIDRPDD